MSFKITVGETSKINKTEFALGRNKPETVQVSMTGPWATHCAEMTADFLAML